MQRRRGRTPRRVFQSPSSGGTPPELPPGDEVTEIVSASKRADFSSSGPDLPERSGRSIRSRSFSSARTAPNLAPRLESVTCRSRPHPRGVRARARRAPVDSRRPRAPLPASAPGPRGSCGNARVSFREHCRATDQGRAQSRVETRGRGCRRARGWQRTPGRFAELSGIARARTEKTDNGAIAPGAYCDFVSRNGSGAQGTAASAPNALPLLTITECDRADPNLASPPPRAV